MGRGKREQQRIAERRATLRSGVTVSDVIRRSGLFRWTMPGEYYRWRLQDVPQEYLEMVANDVTNLEYRDAAQTELWRRKRA